MNDRDGPYETEDQAPEIPAVRAIYDAAHARTVPGRMDEGCHRILQEACTSAGVQLGAHDRRIQTCAVVAGLITRAGTSAQPTPAAPAGNHDLAAAEQRTILAALDEAADHKRDVAANCADCVDQTCSTCHMRLRAARQYEAVSERVQSQLYGSCEIEAEP